MAIQVRSSRRRNAEDPTDFEFLMSDEEIHMANVNAARTIFRVLVPILASGNHPLYYRVLNQMMKRLNAMVTHSAIRTDNRFYRGNTIIRMNDLHYWGTPSGGIWLGSAA